MKYKSIVTLIFCAPLTVTGLSQDNEISGKGTPNFIARFSGTHRISNSTVFQSTNGNVGIGTTIPLFPLHVFREQYLSAARSGFSGRAIRGDTRCGQ